MSIIKKGGNALRAEIDVEGGELSYTDQFFKFPTTIHLTKDVEESGALDEILGQSIVPDGVVGTVRCHAEDIVSWWDSFSAPRTLEDVREKGFDMTHVILKGGEQFTCIWDRKTFERRLNEHMKRVQEKLLNEVDVKFRDTLDKIIEDQKAKLPWWKKIF